jgi:hypothetical protein
MCKVKRYTMMCKVKKNKIQVVVLNVVFVITRP